MLFISWRGSASANRRSVWTKASRDCSHRKDLSTNFKTHLKIYIYNIYNIIIIIIIFILYYNIIIIIIFILYYNILLLFYKCFLWHPWKLPRSCVPPAPPRRCKPKRALWPPGASPQPQDPALSKNPCKNRYNNIYLIYIYIYIYLIYIYIFILYIYIYVKLMFKFNLFMLNCEGVSPTSRWKAALRRRSSCNKEWSCAATWVLMAFKKTT